MVSKRTSFKRINHILNRVHWSHYVRSINNIDNDDRKLNFNIYFILMDLYCNDGVMFTHDYNIDHGINPYEKLLLEFKLIHLVYADHEFPDMTYVFYQLTDLGRAYIHETHLDYTFDQISSRFPSLFNDSHSESDDLIGDLRGNFSRDSTTYEAKHTDIFLDILEPIILTILDIFVWQSSWIFGLILAIFDVTIFVVNICWQYWFLNKSDNNVKQTDIGCKVTQLSMDQSADINKNDVHTIHHIYDQSNSLDRKPFVNVVNQHLNQQLFKSNNPYYSITDDIDQHLFKLPVEHHNRLLDICLFD